MSGTLRAARRTVAANPCASTAAVVSTGTALIAYGASVEGVDLPLWVGSILTGAAISAALTFSRVGLVGVWRLVLYGRSADDE